LREEVVIQWGKYQKPCREVEEEIVSEEYERQIHPHWFVVQPLGKGKRKGTGQISKARNDWPGRPTQANLESAAELMKIEEKYWSGNSSSVALSERAAYSYQDPGFRFAPPWAEVYYAFGVLGSHLKIQVIAST
jgi:hypothetical protein